MTSPLCRVPSYWLDDPSQCWFEWQTLLVGLLAVLAAYVSIRQVRKQISQASQLHDAELSRRHNAIRAVTPLALASISDFCRSVVDHVASEIERREGDNFDQALDDIVEGTEPKKQFSPIVIPNDIIATLQEFIETLSDGSNVRHMAELVSSIQILQSRFNDFRLQQAGSLEGLYGLLLDAAKVQMLNDNLFNYSRFVDESNFSLLSDHTFVEIWDKVNGKAHGMVFMRATPDLFFPRINQKIQSYKENSVSPWNEKFE